MEERIIDDEYAKGIHMKKTKDGYTAEDGEAKEGEEEAVFEFPDFAEDDEELATLTPKQAEEVLKAREEARKKAEKTFETAMKTGYALLEKKDFSGAETAFQTAEENASDFTEVSVALCRARTKDFAEPDALIEHYNADYDDFAYELGTQGVDKIKADFSAPLKARLLEIEKELAPLKDTFQKKQESRKQTLLARRKKQLVPFVCFLLPCVATFLLGVIFLALVNTRPDTLFLKVAIGCFGAFALLMLGLIPTANKLYNTRRMLKKNEALSSTEDGKKVKRLSRLSAFYQKLLGE